LERRPKATGITYIEGEVTGSNGKRDTVRFLVDSGVTYTLLPWEVWQAIGLEGCQDIMGDPSV